MIDVAKVADLILMTIDASFGFEMETFEFLNVLQAHGFPKIMGVLTHLDSPKFKTNNGGAKKLRKMKKKLKHRFWTEIYQGAKLFYLSGLVHGSYPKNEVLNLSRFISVMKFRPLIWRNTHPYLLADRFEDLTPEELIGKTRGKCDRTVTLYGYVRGTNMKANSGIHVPGVGDLKIASITGLADPCELPDSGPDKKKRKRLDDKQKLIYAPMCDLGGLLYDKDAVYINVPGNFSKVEEGDEEPELTEGQKMVMELQDTRETLGEKIESSQIRLFANSKPLLNVKAIVNEEIDGRVRRRAIFDDEDPNGSSDGEDDGESDVDEEAYDDNGRGVSMSVEKDEGTFEFAESDSDFGGFDEDDLGDEIPKWKQGLAEKAIENFGRSRRVNLMDLIYGDAKLENVEMSPNSSGEDGEDDLFRKVTKPKKAALISDLDSLKPSIKDDETEKWGEEEVLESLRNKFITGELNENDPDEDDAAEGDFEDLEENSEEGDDVPVVEDEVANASVDALALKKAQLKTKFDAEYDGEFDDDNEKDEDTTYYDEMKNEMARQLEMNRAEFEDDDAETKANLVGYEAGHYVRIVIKEFPAEFVENFDPHYPIVVGGLLANEDKLGIVQVRIKKHRWYQRILKNNDPLIFSIGWRRFQTLPIYSLNDGSRNRMLKYTPEHMHCLATFFGPVTPPNTGFCCFQSVSDVTVCLLLFTFIL